MIFRVHRNLPGQSVYLFSPGSFVEHEAFMRGRAVLDELGLAYEQDPHCLGRCVEWNYLAGTDEQRAGAISMAVTGGYGAAMAVRGGYGTLRAGLLALDHMQIPSPVPVVMGFSDLTALHALLNRRGVISFHGPNLAGLASTDTRTGQRAARVLSGRAGQVDLSINGLRALFGKDVVRARLFGGNLSVWCSMLGTGLLPDVSNAILLLEEVNEPAYRIDRLLLQLRLAMRSNPPAAVVFGQVTGDGNPDDVAFVLRSFSRSIGVPVVVDATVGHGNVNLPLALNAMYSLDPGQGTLSLLENVYGD